MPSYQDKILGRIGDTLGSFTGEETADELRAKSSELDQQVYNDLSSDEDALKWVMETQNEALGYVGRPTWDVNNPSHRKQFLKLMKRHQSGEKLTLDEISPQPTFGEYIHYQYHLVSPLVIFQELMKVKDRCFHLRNIQNQELHKILITIKHYFCVIFLEIK
jgi:hypothetical protein